MRSDALFEKLLASVKLGEVQDSVRTVLELENQFGSPLLKKDIQGAAGLQEWLYRYQIMSSAAKVYVMVDSQGEIKGFRYEE